MWAPQFVDFKDKMPILIIRLEGKKLSVNDSYAQSQGTIDLQITDHQFGLIFLK